LLLGSARSYEIWGASRYLAVSLLLLSLWCVARPRCNWAMLLIRTEVPTINCPSVPRVYRVPTIITGPITLIDLLWHQFGLVTSGHRLILNSGSWGSKIWCPIYLLILVAGNLLLWRVSLDVLSIGDTQLMGER
jgi:hypothetical protein